MAKTPISAKFAKFADKTTKGDFDKARKQESMAGGCPLPIGSRGIAIVAEISCTETKVKADGSGGDPFVSIKLEVESPEEYRGKTITGPGLMVVIKDGPNSTAADAWARMLDSLEQLGLPREIRTDYSDFAEVVDYFTDEPRRVEYNIQEDTYKGNQSGKITRAVAFIPEGEVATAESPVVETPIDPDADYCSYLGKRHQILGYDQENELYELKMVNSDRIRKGVAADKVTLE